MRTKLVLFLLLTLLLLSAAPWASADPTTPTTGRAPNGADVPAVFTTWARVMRDTHSYTTPAGEAAEELDDWDTWISVRGSQVVGGHTWYRTATGR